MNRYHSAHRGTVRAAIALALVFGVSMFLSACNTTAGAGKDVSAAGRDVTTAADKVKQGL
jgi:predicted small secreted protein